MCVRIAHCVDTQGVHGSTLAVAPPARLNDVSADCESLILRSPNSVQFNYHILLLLFLLFLLLFVLILLHSLRLLFSYTQPRKQGRCWAPFRYTRAHSNPVSVSVSVSLALCLDQVRANTMCAFFRSLVQASKSLKGVVEVVFSGSRVKLILPTESIAIQLSLAQVRDVYRDSLVSLFFMICSQSCQCCPACYAAAVRSSFSYLYLLILAPFSYLYLPACLLVRLFTFPRILFSFLFSLVNCLANVLLLAYLVTYLLAYLLAHLPIYLFIYSTIFLQVRCPLGARPAGPQGAARQAEPFSEEARRYSRCRARQEECSLTFSLVVCAG